MIRSYFDYNATAPIRPEIGGMMQELLLMPLNASSIHAEGRRARSLLETARRGIAEHIGVFPAEVIFTGSGTESNNWVLHNFRSKQRIISAIEHSSLYKAGHNARLLPVTPEGVVDMAQAEALLPEEPGFLVSVMLANNETGIIQPVEAIAALVHARGGLLHCDGAQALGKIPVDFNALGCDLLTLCAHKMGGPVGAAALVVKSNMPWAAHMLGGGQELNRRAGTENVAAIAGFAEAVRRIDLAQMEQLRESLATFEAMAKHNGAVIIGEKAPRVPNTSCVVMPAMSAQTQIMRFDLEGISLSAGAACTSGKVEASHVLAAMNVEKSLAANAVRISGGWETTDSDLQTLTQVWQELANSVRKKSV